MTTVWVPRQAAAPVKAFLTDVFQGQIPVGSNVPDAWTPAAGPVIVVTDDGPAAAAGSARFPVGTRRTVRITSYATGETLAVELVSRAWAELLTRPVPGVANIRDGLAPFGAGRDRSHADAWLGSATVLATVRTAPLS